MTMKPPKSYLGPTAGEKDLSSRRKSTIRESLGAILSMNSEYSSENQNDPEEEEEDDEQPVVVSNHRRRRPRPSAFAAAASSSSTASPSTITRTSSTTTTPRRSKSGGSILSAMHSAGQSLTTTPQHQLPKRSKSTDKPKRRASGLLVDDPFIDALFGATTSSFSSTSNPQQASTNTPNSSRGGNSNNNHARKVWQGIGLEQFKEKMGYRKPTASAAAIQQALQEEGAEAARKQQQAQQNNNEDGGGGGMGGMGRRLMRRRSKSPSVLRDRTATMRAAAKDSEDRGAACSERGTRSIDFLLRRTIPSRSSSLQSDNNILLDRSSCCSERGSRTTYGGEDDLDDMPPAAPLLGYTTPRPSSSSKPKRMKKKSLKQDSFYGLGLEFERDLEKEEYYLGSNEEGGHNNYNNSSSRSQSSKSQRSSSHRRSQRSRSGESPRTKKKCPSPGGGATSVLRTPSSSSGRRKSLVKNKSRPSPCSTTLTPTSISSSQRRTTLSSGDGWGGLELDALEQQQHDDATLSSHTALKKHLMLPQQQKNNQFDGEVSYGEDIDMAMQVGENLMNIGVQLLTRGHDLRNTATSRRNSMVGSSMPPSPPTASPHKSSPHSRGRRTSSTAEPYLPSSPSHDLVDVEVDLEGGESLNTKLETLEAWDRAEHFDETLRSERSSCAIPRQVVYDLYSNKDHDDYSDDDEDVNSDIESLAGMTGTADQSSRSKRSSIRGEYRRNDSISSSASSDLLLEPGPVAKEKSLNSLALMDSSMDMSSTSLFPNDTQDLKQTTTETVDAAAAAAAAPFIGITTRRRSHDDGTMISSSLGLGDKYVNKNKKQLQDSWTCLEFDFSDHHKAPAAAAAAAAAANKKKKNATGRKVRRSKSEGLETMRTTMKVPLSSRSSDKPPRPRSSTKTRVLAPTTAN